jgi:hypothetical protein
MNQLAEGVTGLIILTAALGAALVVLPRAEATRPAPTATSVPEERTRAKADAERIADVQKQLDEVAKAQKQLAEDVEEIAKRERTR